MKRNHYIIALLIGVVASGLSFTTLPDSIFLPYLLKRFQEYTIQNPEEKIYVQTDKPFYKPGDKIWFAVSLRNGQTMQASSLSNIVYAELIDPRGGVYQKVNLKAVEGKSRGFFMIDSMAPGGLYKLKAYTAWMNASPCFVPFEKDIQVQKIIKPRLLWKLDFAKQAYGPGDTVVVNVDLKDLSNTPIIGQPLQYQVLIEGKQHMSSSITTDSSGSFQLSFPLPADLKVNDGVLNLTLYHNGRTNSLSRAIPIVLNKIDIQFMPEGGDWVDGIESKVAFKAVNEFGKPADVEGYITNSAGEKVVTFASFHQGMGAFRLTPTASENYTAHLTSPAGIIRGYSLPVSKSQGGVLAVDSCTHQSLDFHVGGDGNQIIHCIIHIRGKVMFSKTYHYSGQSVHESLPVAQWPAGVAHITLFDDFETPFAERLVFVNPHRKMQVSVTTDKLVYAPREKVKMSLRTTDESGHPIAANLAVSVVNDKIVTFANDKQDNILTSLLLTSDLKGKVFEPSFYFKEGEPKALPAIDYLLLTQGWRRFSWSTVLNGHWRNDFPETYNQVWGQVFRGSRRSGVEAKVALVDVKGNKVATTKTGSSGRFVFTHLDSLSTFTIYAKRLHRKDKNLSVVTSNLQFKPGTEGSNLSIESPSFNTKASGVKKKQVNSSMVMQEEITPASMESDAIMILEDDEQGLDEVVVVGYGVQKKSNLTGSVVSIQAESLSSTSLNVSNLLDGRVPGVLITNDTGGPGSSASVMIRGTASSFGSEPLYLVNGMPMQDIRGLDPSLIGSIEVLKDPSLLAIYGSRAANGVIAISTKSSYYMYHRPKKQTDRICQFGPVNYSRPYLQPAIEFYHPRYQDKDSIVLEPDFRETICWQPEVTTGRDGTATLEFCNSDEVTSFRAIVEGIGSDGLIGRCEYVHSIQKPVSIDATLPPYLLFGDRVMLPVVLTNSTSLPIDGHLLTRLPRMFSSAWPADTTFTVASGQSLKVMIPVEVRHVAAKDMIDLRFGDATFKDRYVEPVEVVKCGFPVNFSFSSRALTTSFSVPVSDMIENSLSGKIYFYNDLLDQVMSGIESVLREPHGCFEQLSATTYPNILILNYLKTTRQANPEAAEKARKFIQTGYKKLAAYETKEGGFEWFGHTPPHEGLTAYGLMEFIDMEEVTDFVDPNLISRTLNYLLSRRNGKGGFHQNTGKYGFSAASEKVTNTYIVMALTHAKVSMNDIHQEFDAALAEARKSEDPYRMALMAHACLNMNDSVDAENLLGVLADKVAKHGVKALRAQQSIVCSYGTSFEVETASLLADALMRSKRDYFPVITTLMDFILSKRANGGFGSSQATVLALKAVINYGKLINQFNENGSVTLWLNQKAVATREIVAGSQSICIDSLQQYMQPGLQNWEVRFNGITNPVPFTMDLNWSINTPNPSERCSVRFNTTLSQAQCKVGDLVRMSVQLKNKTSGGLPMTMAMIGIPSGLTLQPWQLKEMQEKHAFDYYEVHKNYLVLYFREMGPYQTIQLNFDLKAEVAGKYQAPAGNAYLYYTDELRDWVEGEEIEIFETMH